MTIATMSILLLISPFLGPNGLVQQSDGDQGDSAQREGMLLTAAYVLNITGRLSDSELALLKHRFMNIVSPAIIRSDGRLRRTNISSQWGSDWDRGSRDQYHIIIGMGLINQTSTLELMFKDHLTRGLLLTTNTKPNTSLDSKWKLPDFTGPTFWGMWIRAFNKETKHRIFWKSILCIFDFQMLADSLVWRFYNSRFDPSNTDVLNHLQVLVQSKFSLDTPVAHLARYILRNEPLQWMLNDYFAPSTNGVTALAEIYRPIVKLIQEKQ